MSDLNPFPWCSECASWHAPGHHLPDVSSDLAGQLRAKNAEVHTLLLKLDEYEHRAKLHMDRCQHDMERIVALEQQNEALASRLGTAEKLLREWVDWHEDLRPTMPITRTRDFISPAELAAPPEATREGRGRK